MAGVGGRASNHPTMDATDWVLQFSPVSEVDTEMVTALDLTPRPKHASYFRTRWGEQIGEEAPKHGVQKLRALAPLHKKWWPPVAGHQEGKITRDAAANLVL